jgi:hypothetical protein
MKKMPTFSSTFIEKDRNSQNLTQCGTESVSFIVIALLNRQTEIKLENIKLFLSGNMRQKLKTGFKRMWHISYRRRSI